MESRVEMSRFPIILFDETGRCTEKAVTVRFCRTWLRLRGARVGGLLLVLFVLFGFRAPAHGYKVAIFDYERRSSDQETYPVYFERKLREEFGPLQIDHYCGEGNQSVSIDILKRLDTAGYDLIIGITSYALLLANHFVHQAPTLCTNVNNPLFLGFDSPGPPGGNISAASYYVPVGKQLGLYKTIQPSLKRIGFIFDETNKSRKVELRESRDACEELGIQYEIELIDGRSELRGAARRLIGKGVEAVVMTSSDQIYNHAAEFISECDTAGIPVYSFNIEGVSRGAVAALASSHYLMFDKLIIPMARKVLVEKISPGSLPPAFLDESFLFLNLTKAARLNITIPDSIRDQAHKVY